MINAATPRMQVASGRGWNLASPTPAAVHWPDVAEALAKQCRFGGHTQSFYALAQHSVHLCDLLPPDHRLAGLLYDAPAAYLGEITWPVRQALMAQPHGHLINHALRAMWRAHRQALCQAAGIDTAQFDDALPIIQMIDKSLLGAERRDLLADSALEWGDLPRPAHLKIKPWPWPRALEEWMDRLDAYRALGSEA